MEFRNVTTNNNDKFEFYTHGSVDGDWSIENVWNPHLLRFTEPPEDSTYVLSLDKEINDKMVNSNKFNIGFRCDYWSGGSFRVRCIKVQKGTDINAWSPGI